MSGTTQSETTLAPDHGSTPTDWHVRRATRRDVEQVAAAVAELLGELGSAPPPAVEMEVTAGKLLEDRDAGALLVAEASDGAIVGVLAASWQLAIHAAGRYALIQDLWAHRAWRGRGVGRDLVACLCQISGDLEMARIEVGLPRERFAALAATEAFYRHCGFEPLGPRMRRRLP
jgi:GNAT superfamily N-acetyltransferase